MKILVIMRGAPGARPELMAPVLPAETQHAYELYKSGVARELYMRADNHGAVLILECKDAEEAAEICGTLPLVKAGLAKTEIIPLAPFAVWDRLSAQAN